MTLDQIKTELNAPQVGKIPNYTDPTKIELIKKYSGIELLKYLGNFQVGDYHFKYEDSFGGEGNGDDYWIVFSLHKEEEETLKRFYQVPGWYASHCGGELEISNIFEVKPLQKTITVWTEV